MKYTEAKVENLLEDDEGGVILELVLRKFMSGKKVYYARIKIQKTELANNQKRIVCSLKTDSYNAARNSAIEVYSSVKNRQEQGINIKSISVAQSLDSFINDYQDKASKGQSGYTANILRNLRKSIDIYWREYIGKKNLDDVSDKDFEGYEEFRRAYAKNTKRIKNRYRTQYKETVAAATLKGEINYFKQFLQWCAHRGLYKGAAHEWRFKTHERIQNRREAFSIEQYRTLTRYMRTNEYLNKGKHSSNGAADKRIVRHRHMLRAYILFMTNTGLRVGEVRHLRWKDVTGTQNKSGDKVCVVSVDNTLSKVSKGASRSSRVVGRYTAWRAIERWQEYLISIGEDVGDEKFIFCNDKGNVIGDFRAGFDAIIKEAGVDKDRYGNKFVIYCLRHTYITFRLRYGKNLSIHSLAKNARTSVAMIQSHYDDTDTLDFVDELTL